MSERIRVNLLYLHPARADHLTTTSLSDAEHERAALFRRPADRARFVAGRQLLRSVVADSTSASPESVELRVDRGRVFVVDWPDLHISVAHSGQWVGCVVARRPVGLDVEEEVVDAPDAVLVRRTCTPGEAAMLAASRDMRAAFTRTWVRKEALGKATGRGLDFPLHEVDVRADNVTLPFIDGLWSVRDLPVAPGYHAAVAGADGPWTVEVVLDQDRPTAD